MLTLPTLATLAAGVVVTSFLSGIFGMAGGMILMGLLLAIMPLAAAMVLHGITQMASNGWRAVLWRAHIEWRIVGGSRRDRSAGGARVCACGGHPRQGRSPTGPWPRAVPGDGAARPRRSSTWPSPAMRSPAARSAWCCSCSPACRVRSSTSSSCNPGSSGAASCHQGRRADVRARLKLVYFGTALAIIAGTTLSPGSLLAVASRSSAPRARAGCSTAMSDAQFKRWSRGSSWRCRSCTSGRARTG